MILSVIGARPQFIKAAVVSRAFATAGIAESVVHTGQHYDDAMSGRFLRELSINNIIANLNCGSGTHAGQTAQMMVALEKLMIDHEKSIRAVLVYGDTNSSIAAALAASKLHLPVIHVEAGLRSFNRAMPEEINRVVVDHVSELLFCSSTKGVDQLAREGIDRCVHDVGDVMLDAFETFTPRALEVAKPSHIDGPPFAIITIHRPSNTDDTERLIAITTGLGELDCACYWPVHPRLGQRIKQLALPENVLPIEPLSYFEMLASLSTCQCVITDSGGLQKEAYWAKKPCVTVRNETEWVETLEGGWNQLWNPMGESLADCTARKPSSPWKALYGDGFASRRIAIAVRERFSAC